MGIQHVEAVSVKVPVELRQHGVGGGEVARDNYPRVGGQMPQVTAQAVEVDLLHVLATSWPGG